jgi:hypothetical protein
MRGRLRNLLQATPATAPLQVMGKYTIGVAIVYRSCSTKLHHVTDSLARRRVS